MVLEDPEEMQLILRRRNMSNAGEIRKKVMKCSDYESQD